MVNDPGYLSSIFIGKTSSNDWRRKLKNMIYNKGIFRLLQIFLISISLFLFSGCPFVLVNNTIEIFSTTDTDKYKLDANIETIKSNNSIFITVIPKTEKALSYTLFEIKDGKVTEIDRIANKDAYTIKDDGTFRLNIIPKATFSIQGQKRGTFYVAVEVDNNSYKKDDDISIYTKLLFTKLISVL